MENEENTFKSLVINMLITSMDIALPIFRLDKNPNFEEFEEIVFI